MKIKVFLKDNSFKFMYAFTIAEFKRIVNQFDKWEYVL